MLQAMPQRARPGGRCREPSTLRPGGRAAAPRSGGSGPPPARPTPAASPTVAKVPALLQTINPSVPVSPDTFSPTTAVWILMNARTAHVHLQPCASTQWVPTSASVPPAPWQTPLASAALLTSVLLTVTVPVLLSATTASARTPVRSLDLAGRTPSAPQPTTGPCAPAHPAPTETPRSAVHLLSALATQTAQARGPV